MCGKCRCLKPATWSSPSRASRSWRSSRPWQFAILACFGLRFVPRSFAGFALLRSIPRLAIRLLFLDLRFRLLRLCAAAAGDIFLAVGRRDVGRIPVEIGPTNSIVLAVCVDPLPELFGGDPSLRAAVALDAHDVGRKPAAIAATGTAAMVGPVGCGLQAGCDRLTVVVAERAGDAGLQSGLLSRVKRVETA